MQTILGSGGAIGTDLAKALTRWTTNIRLVSRNPKRVNPGDTLFPADLTRRDQVFAAVRGSSVVYVTVGFDYKTSVWRAVWPVFMQNVVDACAESGARLVFFDNVYSIGKDYIGRITEESPFSPSSEKGKIRVRVNQIILEAIRQGKIQAIIARSPDFFGTKKETSMLMIMVYDNLIKGKKAQWMGRGDKPHTMGFTPDLAMGTALLGNSPDGWNEIWNLPVPKESPTGKEWAGLFRAELGGPEGLQVLPVWMVGILGLFIPVMKELHEMLYQFDREYIFDSSKFNSRFGYTAASPEDAVRRTVQELAQ
ncbi:MAG: NAD-dependent epimerase/dehydratase family protein [Bacteroidetes bacterium]|nr:NAD-dependent epimerase/dehydratase family protein [Bacteroidota bacterium]